ncbi:MAG: tetratricopeptide repeat protein [Pirellulaceae bacterium]
MGLKKKLNPSKQTSQIPRSNEPQAESPARPSAHTSGQETYDRVLRHVATGNYQKALDILRSAGRAPRMRNALGVCLMRMDRREEAVRIFRDLVLAAGCTWLKPEAPLLYKINYATSLLLAGHPAGCVEVLADLNAESHASVQQLRAQLKDWERSLSFWQRLNWRFGNIAPKNAPVVFESPPGEIEVDATIGRSADAE